MAFLLKISVLAIAVTMALTITITMKAIPEVEPKLPPDNDPDHEPNTASTEPEPVLVPSKRVSRFLAANNVGTNPRAAPQAADHCKNDNDICNVLGGRCCQNKCIDVSTDKNNCGACKNKCKFTHTCCRGQCVLTAFDKRHCGRCNNRCRNKKLCVYGMCNYG